MKIYIGKSYIKNSIQVLDKSTVIYEGESVLISSDRPPWMNISLGESRTLFVWGHIYAIHSEDGSLTKFEPINNGPTLLRKLMLKNNVSTLAARIEGRYIGIVTNSKSEITIFTDLYNVKDVFFAHNDNCLVAATNLEPVINAFPHTQYNQTALASVFNIYGMSPPKKQTIYEGVHRLGVGERIEYRNGRIKILSEPFTPRQTEEYNESDLCKYSDIFESAVEIRSSKECNWVYLSSGWDSSSILAMLVKIHGPSKIRAIMGRFKYSNKSGITNNIEITRAKKLAEYYSVPLEIIEIDYSGNDFLNYMSNMKHELRDNHLFLPFNYFYMKIAKHTAKHGSQSHAVFNGEISDGAHNLGFSQFATILEHPDLGFREYSDKMASYLYGPSFFKSILDGNYINDFVYNVLCTRSGASFYNAHNLNNNDKKAKYIESFFLSPQRLPLIKFSENNILTDKGFSEYESTMYETYFKPFVDSATPETLYSWILHLYNSFHWQCGTVKGLMHGLDCHNMQVSMPFWDTRIQSFLSAMPESWGRGLELNPTKYPLKWMLQNKVDYPSHLQVGPHSYLYDVNPNWHVFSDLIYGSDAKSYFKDIIHDYKYENILSESNFNLSYLKKITDDYCNDVEVTGQQRCDLFTLIGLSLVGWY